MNGDELTPTPEELTPTPEELAELDALAKEAADPAAWRRWRRQAATEREALREARTLGLELPDGAGHDDW